MKNKKYIIFGIIVIVAAICGLMQDTFKSSNSRKETAQITQNTNNQSFNQSQQKEPNKPATSYGNNTEKPSNQSNKSSNTNNSVSTNNQANQQKRNISSELALDNVVIGDSFSTVKQILGTPYKEETKENGKKYYFYPSVEVHCQNGIVTTLVSNSPDARTPKGIHEGSSLQKVLSMYGQDYMKSNYGGLDLYEYNFTTQNGRSAILRFAINSNGRVDYISIR